MKGKQMKLKYLSTYMRILLVEERMGSGSGRVVDLATDLTSSTLSSIIAGFPFVTIAIWTLQL